MKKINEKYLYSDEFCTMIYIITDTLYHSGNIWHKIDIKYGVGDIFGVGSQFDTNSIKVDSDTTLENVFKKYPELFL